MSGLGLFFATVIMWIAYVFITSQIGRLITKGRSDLTAVAAWLLGSVLFVAVIALWASGRPFPLGGGA